jgi:hypothetical protein
MTSLRGKQTALACHPTKKINIAEELTYLFSFTDKSPTVSGGGEWAQRTSNFL